MQLTPHFRLDEFTASSTAATRGIDNTPKLAGVLANLTLLATALEQIRFGLGRPIHISSGYRCPALNAAVGGSPTSAHSHGLAADINATGFATIDLCRYIEVNLTGFDQCIYEVDQKAHVEWCHFGLRAPGEHVRQQCLTIIKRPDGSKETLAGIVKVA